MQVLLRLILIVLMGCDVFGVGLSLGAGMSVKNLLVYMTGGMLIFNSAFGGSKKFELRSIQTAFAVLIAYAIFSVVAASSFAQYQGYKALPSLIQLKSTLFDWFVFFLVFFYGTRGKEDALGTLRLMLALVTVGNIFTAGKAIGLFGFGAEVTGGGEDTVSRVDGIFGDANETGTMIVTLIPGYVAAAASSRGLRRLFWLGGIAAGACVLLMTASRGAIVGLILGSIAAAYICRRYINVKRAAIISLAIAIAAVGILSLIGGDYWRALVNRFAGVAFTSAADVSSGRTDIWAQAIGLMMKSPVTLITGFGWNSWASMGFVLVAHNSYLWLWFELGLPGVICFIVILSTSARNALAAVTGSDPATRQQMVSLVFSIMIVATGAFFVLLFKPWNYLWPYIAVSLRYALSVNASTAKPIGRQNKVARSARPLEAPVRSMRTN